jgi:hypothetical protein
MNARDIAGRFISEVAREYSERGMAWYPVSSSNVLQVGYNQQTATLGVRFHSGSEYAYEGVPYDVFEALRVATSVGKYLNVAVKPRYQYERLS